MKHLIRKPLLPVLLLGIMVFASCFLAYFREGIRKDREQVDGLYDSTVLNIEVLPGQDSMEQLALQAHKGDFLEELEQITKTLRVMECDAKAGDSDIRIYGTNDLEWFVLYKNLDTELWDGWDWSSFAETEGTVPCIVGEGLQKSLGLSLGDSVAVIPVDYMGMHTDSAPVVTMVAVGFFSDSTYAMDCGIIVPEKIFLYGPKLLYNSNMMYDCFYRTFVMELDTAFNRDYEATEDAVEKILYNQREYELISNFRTLRKAAGPLERKLAVQEQLVLPLEILFGISAMICAVLVAKSFETEIFLRLLWGEKRFGVWCRLVGTVMLWLAFCVLLSAATTVFITGRNWLQWAMEYSGAVSAVCAFSAAVPMGRSCWRNLVKLYQSKEGE